MLGWQPLYNKAMAAGLGLILSVLTTNVEAGVFGWLKRTEIKWSPEIKGVVTEHGKPVTNREVKRRSYYEGEERFDSTTTDDNGRFHFPQKTKKVRRVLFDVSVSMELYVTHYPSKDNQDLVFRIANLNHLNYRSLDLILSDMQCELAAATKTEQLKYLEDPELSDIAPAFSSKCRFTHSGTAVFSNEELQRLIDEDAKNIESF
ncbi:DUF6795 domain-containing protein [Rheinheimera baltica]|uniref:DUF6795 domain-containing protein n=1 Tax=Rheinheimera baltica TaxID=67576 RepID=UPI0004119E0E|nr:DUF6795 domain-containing protein [Rheinheimera baltica]